MNIKRFAPVLLALLVSTPLYAQTGAALMVNPWPEEGKFQANADAYFFNSGHTDNGPDTGFQLSLFESSGRFRVQPGSLVSPRIGYDLTYLSIDSSDPALPDRLSDQAIAIGAPLAKIDEWVVAGIVGIGFAGEHAFKGDGYYAKATLVVGKEIDENSSFGFGLDYDGNRSVYRDIPLPGFVYNRKISNTLALAAGVPVTSIHYKPNERLAIDLYWYLIDRFGVSVGYEVVDHWSLFAELTDRTETFQMDGLSGHDRLFFEQRTIEAGVRYKPSEHCRFIAAAGYAFKREFTTGWNVTDSDELADISDEPYLRVGFDVSY
jgi:hypothetical protein